MVPVSPPSSPLSLSLPLFDSCFPGRPCQPPAPPRCQMRSSSDLFSGNKLGLFSDPGGGGVCLPPPFCCHSVAIGHAVLIWSWFIVYRQLQLLHICVASGMSVIWFGQFELSWR
jgi:hypothetical protein